MKIRLSELRRVIRDEVSRLHEGTTDPHWVMNVASEIVSNYGDWQARVSGALRSVGASPETTRQLIDIFKQIRREGSARRSTPGLMKKLEKQAIDVLAANAGISQALPDPFAGNFKQWAKNPLDDGKY